MTTATFRRPRAPVVVDRVLDDPGLAAEVVRAGSPYFSVQRYLRNLTELAALSDAGRGHGGRDDAPMFIAPWFRGDLAYDRLIVPEASVFFDHPRLFEAARRVFPGAEIVPQIVYVNLNPPMPQVDPGHTDVPAFRGVDRRRYPVWLLVTMLRSGLFERWYVPSVTAVAWYYDGPGGGFRFWPDGPDAPPVDRPCVSNTAVVGDNDVMFHCIHQVGPEGERIPIAKGLTLDSTLALRDGVFQIEDAGQVLARFPYEIVRVSISWKAQVFADERARRLYEDHSDDLTIEEVKEIFLADLRQRGVSAEPPRDLLTDTRFMNALNATYRVAPSIFQPREA